MPPTLTCARRSRARRAVQRAPPFPGGAPGGAPPPGGAQLMDTPMTDASTGTPTTDAPTSTQDLSIAAMGQALRAGTVTAQQLARDALRRIAERDPALQAFLLVTEARAMAEARRADDELRAGHDRGPLHGIPYALKDIYD